jgi:hypothetical protein
VLFDVAALALAPVVLGLRAKATRSPKPVGAVAEPSAQPTTAA